MKNQRKTYNAGYMWISLYCHTTPKASICLLYKSADTPILLRGKQNPSKDETFTQCCLNVGPSSSTLAQHLSSICWMPRVGWCSVFRVQAAWEQTEVRIQAGTDCVRADWGQDPGRQSDQFDNYTSSWIIHHPRTQLMYLWYRGKTRINADAMLSQRLRRWARIAPAFVPSVAERRVSVLNTIWNHAMQHKNMTVKYIKLTTWKKYILITCQKITCQSDLWLIILITGDLFG